VLADGLNAASAARSGAASATLAVMSATPIFIDVFVDPNDNAPEGCGLRFKTEQPPRRAARVRLDDRWYDVVGWSSSDGGSACAAYAALIEDSSAGTAMLVYGGDWGIRLSSSDAAPVGESHLVLDESAVELLA
jgi:hypothetical protein